MPRHTPKGVKKFNTNHLKDTIDRRKQFAKIKQRNQLKDKRRARRAADDAQESDDTAAEEDTAVKTSRKSDTNLANLQALDDLFGRNEFPDADAIANLQAQGKKKAPDSKLGKRKRISAEKEADAASDSSSSEDQAFASNDDEAGFDSEDNDETHAGLEELDLELSDDEVIPASKLGLGGEDDDEDDDKDEEIDSAAVTPAMVKKWSAAIKESHSQAAMREVILAFRAAVHVNEQSGQTFKYSIANSEVYHQVLTAALKGVPDVLAHHLPVKESVSGKVRVPTDSKKYRTLTPQLKSHVTSVTHLLGNVSEAAELNMILSSILPLIPYFLSFKKILKDLVKTVIGIWADNASTEATRINAFLVLRRLAVVGDPSIREAVLKSVYQGLVKGARNTTVHTLAGINVMKNSAVELWGLDPGMGYTTGFTYIRQLAIHLRTSITQPEKDSYKAVYNWQYVHSLDFWSRVLATHCSPEAVQTLKKPSDSPLYPLVYPLVQVTLGALRLVPSPVYFPLRFQLTRALLRISRSTNTYIPLAPSLLEVLQSPEMKRPAKNSTQKPMDFSVNIRASESLLHTRVYQDGLAEQLSELLAEFFGVWAKNVAFPELIIPPTVLVKRWLKEVSQFNAKSRSGGSAGSSGKGHGNKNGKANSQFSLLIQKLQANAAFVEERRRKVDFSVSDKKGVENFLKDVKWEDTPLGSYIVTMRRQTEARERLLEESRQEDERRRKEVKDQVDEDDDHSMSGEEVDENQDDDDESEENEHEDEMELDG